jgi:stress response protein SCP2
MGVSLQKGQGVNLRKEENDLDEIVIGLGWDLAKPKTGLLGGLFGKKPADYDLDAIAVLLGKNGKMLMPRLENGDVVFYNNLQHGSGCVRLTGDNRTGAGDGDDEQIIVRLNALPPDYDRIVFIVAIYQGAANKQSFGEVENAFIRAVDRRGRELVRFNISGNAGYSAYRSMVFAEVQREGSGWNFRAIGQPHTTDKFVDLLQQFA